MAKPMKPTNAWAVVNDGRMVLRSGQLPIYWTRTAASNHLRDDEDRRARVTITEGDGWQPIETAPTNGKAVLLGAYKHLSWAGYWWPCGADTQTGQPGWVDGSRDEHELFYVMEWPTHWQPLPAPPRRKR